ncbi:MAG: hypothetical protein QOH49_172 [Acidobacteriota bacterium]|jgi:hypothetical protein|nr:hypothetical protein [Acidobacteriota bacterium]
MIRRLASFMLAASILCALGVTSASANTPTGAEVKPERASNQSSPRADGDREARPGEKLKADVSKMIADARAGRSGTTMPPRQQQPPQQSNNLSKEQKIVIGVGITVGVLAIIYFSVFAGKHL